MRKVAYTLLFGSLAVTVVLVIVWVLGFFFGSAALGNFFQLCLIAAMFTCLGIFVGIVLLMFSSVRK